ncbi:MAG: radical SAM protein [Pseudomonadota bacterium]
MNIQVKPPLGGETVRKFTDPDVTAGGEARATVPLERLDTLWINTGTLCNIACVNCYIESTPTNDRLVYFSLADARAYFDEIERDRLGTREIGFTGGEPFMNPEMIDLLNEALGRGFEVLVLTNAMQPMQRPRIVAGLLSLRDRFDDRLTLRVSLDHYSQELHETERGQGTWGRAIAGLDWLSESGFKIAIAGRTCWNESDQASREGYAALIAERGWSIDPNDALQLMLLPEMDGKTDVPEITTACWDILNKKPSDMMCAHTRMVVKRKGADRPTVLPCTLLPYDTAFDMGATLEDAANANRGMFRDGAVKLCHPHCAKFCVLGGGSCS